MSDRRRVFILIGIMVFLSMVVGGFAIITLYNTSLEQNRARLIETAKSRARLIESVARHDASYNQGYPGSSETATINQVIEAHGNFEGFGQTGEFTLARLEGDNIVFLLRHRHYDLTYPEPVPLDSNLAEPMQQALAGLSGSLIGRDYRGETVLAAFEPVGVLNLGIVAKIDMAEIRMPFVRAGGIVIGVAIAIIALGIFLFLRVSGPLIKRLKEYAEGLETEITERKQADEKLLESEERFRRFFENEPEFCYMISPDSTIIDVNRTALEALGYNKEELIGKPLQTIYAPESLSKMKQLFEVWKKTGVLRDEELTTISKDGTRRTVLLNADIVKNKEGKVLHSVSIQRDITERKMADQIKDEFIGMVSHELKTPLTVIMGTLNVLANQGLSEQQARELLQDAIGSADVMATIVENLLELSRSQAGHLILQVEPTDIVEVAQIVARELQSKLTTHHVIVDSVSEQAIVLADPVRVERILYNLVENAIKYSPEGGDVRVSAHRQDNQIVVEVSDQGIGISREDQLRLFQSFERIDAYKANSIAGIGLGLTVCRLLVQVLGGHIWIESEPGKGSTFFFTLPAVDSGYQARS